MIPREIGGVRAQQALQGPPLLLRGEDWVEVDVNAGRAEEKVHELTPEQHGALAQQLERSEFFRDCLCPWQLDLKVGTIDCIGHVLI